jgi:hypothetical protein
LDFVRAYMHAINQLFPDTPARQPKSLNLGDPSQLEGVVRDAGFRAAKFRYVPLGEQLWTFLLAALPGVVEGCK